MNTPQDKISEKFSGQTSQNKQNGINILEAQIRECFGRVVWSHKTHEKCSDILLETQKRIKFWQIVFSALTTTGFFVAILGNNKIASVIGIIVSTALLALNAYTKDYDLGEIAQKHVNAASQLWDIRESYVSLISDIKIGNLTIEEIKNKRDSLQEELANIYRGAPRTNIKAYNIATNSLKTNEELTFEDSEIDAFLPKELRKTSL